MDIFKMATQIANNMSAEDKSAIENMDMEKMISHVTKNVFKMMNGGESENLDLNLDLGTPEPSISDESYLAPKTRDICFDLNVDLEDFFTGKKKKLHIKRKRIIEIDGKQKVVEEKKKIIIPIERGMKDEQQIRFEGEADQIPGYTPGDIIISLIENEHPVFQRDNNNLIIVKNINLYQIYDYSFDITHLDSSIIRITKNKSDALHLNDSMRKITGQGMPIYKNKNKLFDENDSAFGDLFIRFNLVIPKSLEPAKLALLNEIFNEPEVLAETYNSKFLLENVTETDLEDFDSDSSSESETDTDDSGTDVSSVSSAEYVSRKR
jgi:DnaJ-class molecular chaperone